MAENGAESASRGKRGESVSNGERGVMGRPRGVSKSTGGVGATGRPRGASTSDDTTGISGRVRKASVSAADAILNFNPQPGMWAATGTAIAYAPTLTELREPVAGRENIEFNKHGHSARTVVTDDNGALVLTNTVSRTASRVLSPIQTANEGQRKESIVYQREYSR